MSSIDKNRIVAQLRQGLVVSVQALPQSPLDSPAIVRAMSLAAIAGGACALRIEGLANLQAVAPHVQVPLIGIIKRDLADCPVRITPWVQDVMDLAAAGAHIIAVDATARSRPASVTELVQATHAAGCLSMADCATLADGLNAHQIGCELIGTTLSGYTAETQTSNPEPDFELIEKLSQAGCRVVAEGRLRTPAQAALALQHGAYCVTVGSAITRIEHITDWFVASMASVSHTTAAPLTT